ncbi:MAG: type VI secretion system-associated protein TagF [Myxococcales bacterium]|nr:type VI secretion system-associated protein TagF [Myxococcales bacterium]
MAVVGLFGKVPSFGDFVSVGTGTPGYQTFVRWLEGCNDVLVERGHELGKDPLGFMFRIDETDSLLVGMLVGSIDSVGRTFPLSLFYEVSAAGICVASLPQAMAMPLGRLASLARKARSRTHEAVRGLVGELEVPADKELAIRSHAELHRLRIVKARMMLERVFGEGHAPHYGASVILQACALAPQRKASAPLVLEGHARTDIELMFLLACVDGMSGGQQPKAALWEVRSQRAFFVLGPPDPRLLALMASNAEADRLWPLWTERQDVARKSRDELGEECRALLDEPEAMKAKDFLDAMAIACKPRPDEPAAPAERQRQKKWQRRVL